VHYESNFKSLKDGHHNLDMPKLKTSR